MSRRRKTAALLFLDSRGFVADTNGMIEIGELRRLERWMSYLRWFGFSFGMLAVTLESTYPDRRTQRLALFLIAVLALGNLAITSAMRRARTRPREARVGALAFSFDAVIILALVWVFAFERPYVTWALLTLLPMEGALRYRLRGALSAAVLVTLFFMLQTGHRAQLLDQSFDVNTYVFVVGLTGLIAGVTGFMAEDWHAQSRAFRLQSLKLSEVDKLKDRFLAITSHEIRGPLTAIIAGVDTMWRRGDRLSEDQRSRLLEMVSRQGHHVARLVDDLLVTSQLQAGKLALQIDWVELESVVQQALDAATPKRRSHQLEVFVDPLRCRLDASRVGQIVRNLVENAYKYTPERTRVAVTAKGVQGGIVIEVDDDGDGIPVEQREQLFEAFSRIEETSAGQDGVGLGLYVVSQLVAAMEGHIDLSSSVRGTTFSIHIPCVSESMERPQLGLLRSSS
jgi:signal transduction histidine kinase